MEFLGNIFVTLVLTFILSALFKVTPIISWFIGINLTTFFAYRHDKKLAEKDKTRIAESVLLGLAVVGGTIGAYVAMQKYRHKINKKAFRRKFWFIFICQLLLVTALVCWITQNQ